MELLSSPGYVTLGAEVETRLEESELAITSCPVVAHRLDPFLQELGDKSRERDTPVDRQVPSFLGTSG